MASLRFLSALLALAAAMAFLFDVTPFVTGTGPLRTTALGVHWAEIMPRTLEAAKTGVSNGVSPALWQSVIVPVLDLPAFVIFAILSALAGYAGRRRRDVKIHIN